MGINHVFVVILCLQALAFPCHAVDTVTVPLMIDGEPLLVQAGDELRLEFDTGRELIDVTELRIHVSGKHNSNRSICWNFGNFAGGTWSYDEDAGLAVGLVESESVVCVTAQVLPWSGTSSVPFDVQWTLECGAKGWTFPSAGAGTIVLDGLGCEHRAEYPEVCICEYSASVTSTELIVVL